MKKPKAAKLRDEAAIKAKSFVDSIFDGGDQTKELKELDEFEKAVEEVMRDLESGKLYEEQLAAMKATGLDPTKPIELTFDDGKKVSLDPLKSIEHLKPPTKKRKP